MCAVLISSSTGGLSVEAVSCVLYCLKSLVTVRDANVVTDNVVNLTCMPLCVQGSCSCSGQFDSSLQQSLDWETVAKQFEGSHCFCLKC